MSSDVEMEIIKCPENFFCKECDEEPIIEDEDPKEEQRNYNKQYYKQNKERLQEKYKSRVKCLLCDKEVAKSSLSLHYQTKLCKKRQELKVKQMLMNNRINTELDDYYVEN